MSETKLYTAAIITVSDKGAKGEREDISGQVINDILSADDFTVVSRLIVPDERDLICEALVKEAGKGVNLVLTTGGTGFSKRDITPEATADVVKRRADAITQAILFNALQKTDRAMLGRGIAGIRESSLIINLPGSPKACEEDLTYILPAVKHGIDILIGTATECAKKD